MTKSLTNHRFSFLIMVMASALLLPLAGCTNGASAREGEAAETSGPTIENCGVSVQMNPNPQRVVTIKSTPLELMLALGLEDRVVGSAFLDGPVPADLTPAGWTPNIISEDTPSQELLIAAQPDLVFAGWESNLSSDGIGTRSDLLKLGIRSYVAPPACTFGGDSSKPLEFADIFDMFTQVGTLFEVTNRAKLIIQEQQDRLSAVEPLSKDLSALWFSSGGDTPFVGGGTGAPNMIMAAAGLANVASTQPQSWFSMPWEAFVASDPDVIVLVDSPWNSAAQKRELLEANPAARTMRAVRSSSFIIVDFATTEAGVRNIEAVETIAQSARKIATTQ